MIPLIDDRVILFIGSLVSHEKSRTGRAGVWQEIRERPRSADLQVVTKYLFVHDRVHLYRPGAQHYGGSSLGAVYSTRLPKDWPHPATGVSIVSDSKVTAKAPLRRVSVYSGTGHSRRPGRVRVSRPETVPVGRSPRNGRCPCDGIGSRCRILLF